MSQHPIFYIAQERAFAPGIVKAWPAVFRMPRNCPNGRLVLQTHEQVADEFRRLGWGVTPPREEQGQPMSENVTTFVLECYHCFCGRTDTMGNMICCKCGTSATQIVSIGVCPNCAEARAATEAAERERDALKRELVGALERCQHAEAALAPVEKAREANAIDLAATRTALEQAERDNRSYLAELAILRPQLDEARAKLAKASK